MNAPALRAPRVGVRGAAPKLEEGEVHVWRIDLDRALPADVHDALDAADRARAASFHFELHRNRYLQGRHALRTLLGRYLDVDPSAVPLVAGAHGKPRFADGVAGPAFNLAHSAGLALLAIGRFEHLGVDVEHLASRTHLRDLARTVFCAAELDALEGCSDEDLVVPFYTAWTRKEACLKALGVGLVVDPREVDAGVHPVNASVRVSGSRMALAVQSVALEPGIAAALAVSGSAHPSVRPLRHEPS